MILARQVITVHNSGMALPEPQEPQAHLGPFLEPESQRDQFDSHELAIVLSHYDLGQIEQIREYRRGSRRAPKVRIKSQSGRYLLKRRAPGRDDPYRVAFAQSLQLFLAERNYPIAALVGTRGTNNSLLQLNGRIYELFHYAPGTRYDESVAQTHEAGRVLGALHRLLATFKPPFDPPVGAYHGAAGLEVKLSQIPDAVAAVEPQADRKMLKKICVFLHKTYNEAAKRVDKFGYRSWPKVIIHGDWHPGNLLFHDSKIAAVLDFDSARLEPRMADIANAVLQFSMRMSWPDDPDHWPVGLDAERVRALVRGYHETAGDRLTDQELASLPWLIVEALIMESVVPIAATGSFGRIRASSFLRMVERESRWIVPRAEKLVRYLGG